MKEFRYEAIDAKGQPIHGIVEAMDEDALRALLKRRGQSLLSSVCIEIPNHKSDMNRVPTRLSQLRITESVRTAFLTQLPIDVALRAVAREPSWNPASALLPWVQSAAAMLLAITIAHALVSGTVVAPLYVAIAFAVLAFGPATVLVRHLDQQPKRLLRRMATQLRAGDLTHTAMSDLLPGNLGEIARSDLPEDQKLMVISELMSGTPGAGLARFRLFATLSGPVFFLIAAVALCYGFLAFVVPGFREIFEGFDLDLPALTRFVVAVSQSVEFLGVPGTLAIGLFGIGIFVALYMVMYRGWMNTTLQTVPLVGAGLKWVNLAGVARWLAAMLRNNAAPANSLQIAVRQSHSETIQQDGQRIAEMINNGKMISPGTTSLSGLPLSLLSGLAKEPTDNHRRQAVATTLDSLAGMFERAVFSSGRIIATLLQLVVLIIVSTVFGLTVLALFLPLVQLLNDLS